MTELGVLLVVLFVIFFILFGLGLFMLNID